MVSTKNNTNLIACAAVAIVGLASIVIAISCYGMSLPSWLVFALFIIAYVQLPGLFIVDSLGLKFNHFSTRLAVGFFVGWAAELLIYFITELINTNVLLYIAGPIATICFFIRFVRSNAKLCVIESCRKVPLCLSIFTILVLLYALLNTQFAYINPAISDWTYINPDKAYHMGLINSLSHGYPLKSLWIDGVIINYHIFTEILYSIPVRLFGLDADFITMSCTPYLTTYCLGISFYSFFQEMTVKKERAGLYCLFVVLSNLYIARNAHKSLAFHFAIINDNSAGYGIAASLITIVLLKYWYDEEKVESSNKLSLFLLSAIFIMLTTGIKGPMGAVLIGGIWGTMILGLILKKLPVKFFVPVLIFTALFAFIYLTILGSKGQSNGNGDSVIAFATIANVSFWKKPLVAILKAIGIPKMLRLIVVLVVFFVFMLTAFFLPFIMGYIREFVLVITKRREFDFIRIVVYASCTVGLIAMFILNYSGHSQIYFGLVSVFLAPIISIWFFEDVNKKAASIIGIIFIVCIAATTTTLGVQYYHDIKDAIHNSNPHIVSNKYLSITRDEYLAFNWLEENSDEDALVAIDRYYSVSLDKYSYQNRWSNRFFLYGAYGNRFSYISGSGYNLPAKDWRIRKEMITTNSKLYDKNNKKRGDLARSLGVDYVIVSKRLDDVGDLSNDDYLLCYHNRDVAIYEIVD